MKSIHQSAVLGLSLERCRNVGRPVAIQARWQTSCGVGGMEILIIRTCGSMTSWFLEPIVLIGSKCGARGKAYNLKPIVLIFRSAGLGLGYIGAGCVVCISGPDSPDVSFLLRVLFGSELNVLIFVCERAAQVSTKRFHV